MCDARPATRCAACGACMPALTPCTWPGRRPSQPTPDRWPRLRGRPRRAPPRPTQPAGSARDSRGGGAGPRRSRKGASWARHCQAASCCWAGLRHLCRGGPRVDAVRHGWVAGPAQARRQPEGPHGHRQLAARVGLVAHTPVLPLPLQVLPLQRVRVGDAAQVDHALAVCATQKGAGGSAKEASRCGVAAFPRNRRHRLHSFAVLCCCTTTLHRSCFPP